MSAYTTNVNLEALLWANNTVTIDNLEAELRHQSCDWTLNEWDIPVCEEDAECSICEGYTDHFLARLSRADVDSADEVQGGSSAEDEEPGRKDLASPGSDSELEEVQEKSMLMKKLLRLRDLRVREQSYKSEDPNNLQGMMVALNFDKLRAEADRNTANSCWSMVKMEKDTLQKSLQTLTEAHNELQTRHQAALDEIEVLKQRLSVVSTITESAPAAVSTIPTFLHCEWLAMKMPPPSSSPQLLACWLQFQEHTSLKGVHVCGPHWVIDLRDLRGYREVMRRIPELRANSGSNNRQNRARFIFAVLEVLAVPGRYAELLREDQRPVVSEVRYSPLSLPEGHNNMDVSRLLAAQGLTVAVADDTWQYSYRHIKSVAEEKGAHNTKTNAAQKILADIEAQLQDMPQPGGLKSSEADRFPRPSNLPNKRL
ncbi:hypothetical protein K438DRAFT_1965480 [Mycena galopus ATCC 62051]|nr:hypothetical protein K438DRAFT_1965480 [Mycena galopus ATCC 62051]